MKKLVVEHPSTGQRIVEVPNNAKCLLTILWDTSKDGPLPVGAADNLGALERVNGQLIVNQTTLAAVLAAKQAANDAETQKNQRVQQAKQNLNQANLANADPDLTPLQIRQLLRQFRVILKDVSKALD